MPETRFTEFPALLVGPRVEIFFTYDIKYYYLSFVISFFFDISRRITAFTERQSAFFMVVQK